MYSLERWTMLLHGLTELDPWRRCDGHERWPVFLHGQPKKKQMIYAKFSKWGSVS